MARFLSILFVVCALAAPAHAQSATVSGTVVDESGAVVPGATVTLAGGSARQSTVSDAQGEYRFSDVLPGIYQVTVTLVGFATATRNDVIVSSGNVEVPRITMALGTLNPETRRSGQ